MGTPKEWLSFEGEPMLVRVVRLVSAVFRPIVVAARPGQQLPPLPDEVEIARDRHIEVGPLGGIEAAMTTLVGRVDAAFIAGCDHPFLASAFLSTLAAALGDARAVVPTEPGRIHALPGIYRIDTLPILVDLLREGDHRVQAYATRCAARRIELAELQSVDPELLSLRNLNTPELHKQFLGGCESTSESACPDQRRRNEC